MKLKDKVKIPNYTLGEELISAISHGIGILLSIVFLVLCILISSKHNNYIWFFFYNTIYNVYYISLFKN